MTPADIARVSTGVPGLDDVLGGGLPAERMYLVQGFPGAGKTTLALQYLLEGVRAGERALYISLSETHEEILQVAQSHGWSLDGLDIYDFSGAQRVLDRDENTLYVTEDVELRETVNVILAEIERVRPKRVVFDSLSEIRLLAQTASVYRRQILALKRFFLGRRSTILLLDDCSGHEVDAHVESIAHGVITLGHTPRQYGADRRRLRVVKLRGSMFRSGHHDFAVQRGGIVVFPRLVAAEHRSDHATASLPSGSAELDAMLGGGVDSATSTLILGPAGAGKSAIGAQFVHACTRRGDRAAVFLFEERAATFRQRAAHLGVSFDGALAKGLLELRQVDPAELAPDELTAMIRDSVENRGTRLVLIDSINAYFTAMPEENYMALHMHELLAYLAERGVATLMTMAQSGLVGTMTSPIDVSYLSDTVLLLRYFEAEGRVRKAVSVMKKRTGRHEDSIRELHFDARGIHVGEPLSRMRGVLTGVPHVQGPDGSARAAI